MEYVDIIDENDHVIRSVPRNEMRTQKLRHRSTAILVFNKKGELFIHQRTMSKDIFPGYYDIAVGGVVTSGESYDLSAKRELSEELGITGIRLNFLFKVSYESDIHKSITAVYSCEYDGLIRLQKEEIAHGSYMDLDSVKELVKIESIPPDSLLVFQRYLQYLNSQ